MEGEFRPRSEYRNGYRIMKTADVEPAFFISQRARLSLRYQTELYKIKLSGQDVRVWGEVEQLGDTPNVNVHEAWAEVKVADASAIKMGRQELIYDDQRLLGSVNWTQQGRSHDALVLKLRKGDGRLSLDLGGAYNQEAQNLLGNTYTLKNYKVLTYIWLQKKWENFQASFIGITDGFERPSGSVKFRYTYGTHLQYRLNGIHTTGTVYLQSGDDATRENIRAYMYAVKAGYELDAFHLSAGYDYLSGGGADDPNPRRHAFNTLYATNHKFYGHMDYFLNVPADSRFGGLQDLYVQAVYKRGSASNISLTYHYFALAEAAVNPTVPGEILEKGLGSEIDFSLAHSFSSDISLKVGYSLLSPSGSMETLRGVDADGLQSWAWVMLSIHPQFVK